MDRARRRSVAAGLLAFACSACATHESAVPGTSSSLANCRAVVGDDDRPVEGQGLEWRPAPDPADRSRLDEACGSVGPAVVAVRSVPGAPARLEDVIFVTWNMHADAGDLAALVDRIRKDAASRSPRTEMVIFVQEAFRAGPRVPAVVPPGAAVPRAVRTRGGTRDDVVAAAHDLGMHLVYVPSMRNGRDAGPDGPEDRGNAILSTLPLSEIAAVELPLSRHRRVAVAATVSGAGAAGRPWRVRVMSVHLNTVGSWKSLYVFSSHLRERQARHAIEALGDAGLAVVGADVNSWSEGPAEPAVTLFRRALPDGPSPRWQPTFRGFWRLDFLFMRLPAGWAASSHRPDQSFGSDHRPVVARIAPAQGDGLPQ